MEIKSISDIIAETREEIDLENYEQAYKIAKEHIDLNKEYNEGEYVFKNLLEEVLFQVHIKKEIKRKYPLVLDYSTMYSNYGEILLKFERFDEAEKSFLLSNEYNPTNIQSIFGLAEIEKNKNNLENYKNLILDSFKFAYSSENLVKSFEKLAIYYFSKKSENDEKIGSCLKIIANTYSSDENFDQNNYPDGLNNLKEVKEFLKENNLPYQASIEIITICKTLGFQLEESKKVIPALHYFQIAYDLSKDENIKITINDLNEKIEKRMNE